MKAFQKHELLEMEVLEKLKSARLLDPLVFGGGTMLRLCHDSKRYSVDLGFWRIKDVPERALYLKLKRQLERDYQVTDAEIKRFTVLIEIRSAAYPRRLKIEIRRQILDWELEETIAYSPFSTRQVLLKAHTLQQTMKNKIAALLERGEIRDGFDIEFLLKKGISLPDLSRDEALKLARRVDSFKLRDFSVKLGSVLEKEQREYYVSNGFKYLRERLPAN